MTDKKEDPKGKTLGRQMAEEFAAAINKRVMEKEQKATEKPRKEAAENLPMRSQTFRLLKS